MHTLNTLNTADMATAALHYYAMGWHVIPLQEKKPVTQWTTDPPLNSKALSILYEQPTTFNIGIRMGKASGMIGLDVDGEAGKRLLWDYLNDCKQPLPRSWKFETPNGGIRLLYRYVEGVTSRSIRINGKEAVRVLSDGTQTVAPPSKLDDGRQWLWTDMEHPAIDDYPAALLYGLRSPANKNPMLNLPPTASVSSHDAFRRARKYLQACDPAVSGAGGHNQTFKIAVKLVKGFNLSYHEALELLMTEYNPRCEPPWNLKEIEHKLDEALKVTSAYRNML